MRKPTAAVIAVTFALATLWQAQANLIDPPTLASGTLNDTQELEAVLEAVYGAWDPDPTGIYQVYKLDSEGQESGNSTGITIGSIEQPPGYTEVTVSWEVPNVDIYAIFVKDGVFGGGGRCGAGAGGDGGVYRLEPGAGRDGAGSQGLPVERVWGGDGGDGEGPRKGCGRWWQGCSRGWRV
jgi:hypothetical protein